MASKGKSQLTMERKKGELFKKIGKKDFVGLEKEVEKRKAAVDKQGKPHTYGKYLFSNAFKRTTQTKNFKAMSDMTKSNGVMDWFNDNEAWDEDRGLPSLNALQYDGGGLDLPMLLSIISTAANARISVREGRKRETLGEIMKKFTNPSSHTTKQENNYFMAMLNPPSMEAIIREGFGVSNSNDNKYLAATWVVKGQKAIIDIMEQAGFVNPAAQSTQRWKMELEAVKGRLQKAQGLNKHHKINRAYGDFNSYNSSMKMLINKILQNNDGDFNQEDVEKIRAIIPDRLYQDEDKRLLKADFDVRGRDSVKFETEISTRSDLGEKTGQMGAFFNLFFEKFIIPARIKAENEEDMNAGEMAIQGVYGELIQPENVKKGVPLTKANFGMDEGELDGFERYNRFLGDVMSAAKAFSNEDELRREVGATEIFTQLTKVTQQYIANEFENELQNIVNIVTPNRKDENPDMTTDATELGREMEMLMGLGHFGEVGETFSKYVNSLTEDEQLAKQMEGALKTNGDRYGKFENLQSMGYGDQFKKLRQIIPDMIIGDLSVDKFFQSETLESGEMVNGYENLTKEELDLEMPVILQVVSNLPIVNAKNKKGQKEHHIDNEAVLRKGAESGGFIIENIKNQGIKNDILVTIPMEELEKEEAAIQLKTAELQKEKYLEILTKDDDELTEDDLQLKKAVIEYGQINAGSTFGDEILTKVTQEEERPDRPREGFVLDSLVERLLSEHSGRFDLTERNKDDLRGEIANAMRQIPSSTKDQELLNYFDESLLQPEQERKAEKTRIAADIAIKERDAKIEQDLEDKRLAELEEQARRTPHLAVRLLNAKASDISRRNSGFGKAIKGADKGMTTPRIGQKFNAETKRYEGGGTIAIAQRQNSKGLSKQQIMRNRFEVQQRKEVGRQRYLARLEAEKEKKKATKQDIVQYIDPYTKEELTGSTKQRDILFARRQAQEAKEVEMIKKRTQEETEFFKRRDQRRLDRIQEKVNELDAVNINTSRGKYMFGQMARKLHVEYNRPDRGKTYQKKIKGQFYEQYREARGLKQKYTREEKKAILAELPQEQREARREQFKQEREEQLAELPTEERGAFFGDVEANANAKELEEIMTQALTHSGTYHTYKGGKTNITEQTNMPELIKRIVSETLEKHTDIMRNPKDKAAAKLAEMRAPTVRERGERTARRQPFIAKAVEEQVESFDFRKTVASRQAERDIENVTGLEGGTENPAFATFGDPQSQEERIGEMGDDETRVPLPAMGTMAHAEERREKLKNMREQKKGQYEREFSADGTTLRAFGLASATFESGMESKLSDIETLDLAIALSEMETSEERPEMTTKQLKGLAKGRLGGKDPRFKEYLGENEGAFHSNPFEVQARRIEADIRIFTKSFQRVANVEAYIDTFGFNSEPIGVNNEFLDSTGANVLATLPSSEYTQTYVKSGTSQANSGVQFYMDFRSDYANGLRPLQFITDSQNNKAYLVQSSYGGKATPMPRSGVYNKFGEIVCVNRLLVGDRVAYWCHTNPRTSLTAANGIQGGKPVEVGTSSQLINNLDNPLAQKAVEDFALFNRDTIQKGDTYASFARESGTPNYVKVSDLPLKIKTISQYGRPNVVNVRGQPMDIEIRKGTRYSGRVESPQEVREKLRALQRGSAVGLPYMLRSYADLQGKTP